MAATVGSLNVNATLQTAQFDKSVDHLKGKMKGLQTSLASAGSKMASIGQKLSVGLTLPFAAFAAKGIKEAQETAQAMGQVNAALNSMGPVAGRTSDQLTKMADSLEMNSLFEADQILGKVTANLLTFGNVSGKVFDRAQQAAVDLSARLGQDLQSSAIQVGKALNDPVKGITALARVGVSFTEQQKQQIKAMAKVGDVAGAQAIILGELEKQFGGAAAAAQNADPWNKATDAFNQMAEKVGTALLPLIPPLTDAIISVADAFSSLSPTTQKWVLIMGGMAAVVGPFLAVIGPMVAGLGSLLPLVLKLGPAFAVLRVAMLALLANPVVLGAAAVIGGIYLAWKNWDKITDIVSRVYNAVKGFIVDKLLPIVAGLVPPIALIVTIWKNWDKIGPIVQRLYQAVKTWAQDKLSAVFNWLKGKLEAVGKWFFDLYKSVVGNSYIPDMVEGIAQWMAKLDAVMVKPAQDATSKTAEAFRKLQQETKGLLDRLFPESASLNQLRSEMTTLEAAMRKGIITAEQYAAALSRLQMEGLTDVPISVADTPSLVPENDDIAASVESLLNKMPQVVDKAKEFREVMSNVAADLAQLGGDWLTAFIDGSAKLKDLWKGILSYAIKALTSPTGPLSSILGGGSGVNLGSLFGSIFKGAGAGGTSAGAITVTGLPTTLPGFASGGSMVLRGIPGIDKNLISMNGIPIARANYGERLSFEPANDRVGGGRVINQSFNFPNSDADSFRRSESQVARAARRRLGV